MSDKKELPVSGGGHFHPCSGQTNINAMAVANANGSQVLSSNFNPLTAAAFAFNPMAAAGYPSSAFYSSPFSVFPFPVATNSNPMSAPTFFNSHATSNLFGAFPPATNGMWPNLLPPDYLLNVAALQSLQHQPNLASSMMHSTETFNDVLKKMPKALTKSTVDGGNQSSSSAHDSLPSTSLTSSSTSGFSVVSKSGTKPGKIAASPSASGTFSATSLAICDQKPSSGATVSSNDVTTIRQHSSSLATLAEIASSLQNDDHRGMKSSNSKHTQDRKTSVTQADSNTSPSRSLERSQHRKTAIDIESKSSVNSSKGPALDFSRKRPSSKLGNGTVDNEEVGRSKEPKLEIHQPSDHSTNQTVHDLHQKLLKAVSKKDEKGKDMRQDRQEPSSHFDRNSMANAAASLFGASLSSDLKMDPNLLNASAMAWAALSNQWLLANVQNEIFNRAVTATAAQRQKQPSTAGSCGNRQQNTSKPSANTSETCVLNSSETSSDKARIYHRNDGDNKCRQSSRGRPSINRSPSSSVSSKKDAVDVTIDAVIKKQQIISTDEHSESRSSSVRSKRGRGSRGGITVREQLAARRGSQSSSDKQTTKQISKISNGFPTQIKAEMDSTVLDGNGASSDMEMAALDLSVKAQSRNSDVSSSDIKLGIQKLNQKKIIERNGSAFNCISKQKSSELNPYRLPLTKGWRRQTYVRSISSSCIRGDVIYYGPCGKRLGSYAEIIRYLNKNGVRDMSRDNFSFSCKMLVGEFLQVKSDEGKNGFVKLTEKEIRDLLSKFRPAAALIEGRNGMGSLNHGAIRRSSRRNLALLSGRNAARRSFFPRFGASLDSHKTDTNPENRQGWETKRLDRQRDVQLSDHERKRKMDAIRNQKVMEALQRAKAKEMRQQKIESLKKEEENYMQRMVILANLEREKVRQQMMFARALEARKRQEEKERLYAEKLIRQEERLAARTASLIRMRQMRQPVEDMEIEDSKELPQLKRMENMELSGQAFADLLMVMEFIKTFGHVLKIEETEIPSISDVHAGLLNDSRGVRSLRNLVKTLLLLVLEYPGLPAGNGSRTISGQVAKDAGVTDMNMSELLRMFLLSRDDEGKKLGNQLNVLPFEALSSDHKASILAYMCNELLYCRNVVREIEGNIDVIAKVKSDRWAAEGKIRHMKVVKASKRKNEKGDTAAEEASASDAATSTTCATMKVNEEDDDDEDGDSSDNDVKEDTTRSSSLTNKRMPKMLFGITAGEIESISKEERLMSVDEVDKELEKLYKEMHELRSRVNEVAVRVRAFPFGQDRYNRYYWILPHHAGVFVEGIESGGANNPAIRHVHLPVRLPSPLPAARCSSPPKPLDDVHNCVVDMVETIVRSDSSQLDSTYTRIQQERQGSSNQECDNVTEISKSITKSRIYGNKKRQIPADMQRCWWLISDADQLDLLPPHLHHRGIRERQLNRLLTKHSDHIKRTAFQAGKDIVIFNSVDKPVESEPAVLNLHAARKLLNMMRQLEEKVFHANVHLKGWKPTEDLLDAGPVQSTSDGTSSDSSCDSVLDARDKYQTYNMEELLTVVKERLLGLEENIERRYFAPAFNRDANRCNNFATTSPTIPNTADGSVSSNLATNETNALEEDNEDDDIPLALQRWRNGVENASNVAQLSMCLEELDAQVVWEKSVMKAACQICRGGDNESQLLLCDGCDMGYHTYCFKPKLDMVPEGDWYCPECIAKASRRPCCLLCCRQAGRPMIACSECSKNFHLDCLPGPVKKAKNGAWVCSGCCSNKLQPKCARSSTDESQNLENSTSIPSPTKPLPAKKKQSKKKTPVIIGDESKVSPSSAESCSTPPIFPDLCSIMLAELDAHKDAGPFRLPVDMKGCPLYKKVIKQPMDLSTIQSKLSNKRYQNEMEFINDVKLIFNNCRTFNEDDSPVGKAGHALRRYFNRRWKELKGSTNKK